MINKISKAAFILLISLFISYSPQTSVFSEVQVYKDTSQIDPAFLKQEIKKKFGITIYDNDMLDSDQLVRMKLILENVPKEIYDLEIITVNEFLNGQIPEPDEITRINILGTKVGEWLEDAIPDDKDQKTDGFTIAFTHELNHRVSHKYNYRDMEKAKLGEAANNLNLIRTGEEIYLLEYNALREKELLRQAHNDHLQYIRSMFPDNFFTTHSDEFFALLANAYFQDTKASLELGIKRFNEGYKEPINQVLFFAEVYSQDANTADLLSQDETIKLYNLNEAGMLSTADAPVERDNNNHISSIAIDDQIYQFERDEHGNVISISVNTPPPTTYTLTVQKAGTGAGSTTPEIGTHTYNTGTSVQITATANSDSSFTGWSGDASGTSNSTTIVMNSNKTVTANFTANPNPPPPSLTYTLTINSQNGTVTKNPDLNSYNSGTQVTLTATPYTGYQFSSWSGVDSSTGNTATVTMNSNKTVTANFTANPNPPPTLNPKANDQSITVKEGSSEYITLTGTDANGQSFSGYPLYTITNEPSKGALALTYPNNSNSSQYRTYQANSNINFGGSNSVTDSFKFKLRYQAVDSDEATVTITITKNNPPLALAPSGIIQVYKNTGIQISLGASDSDGDQLSYNITVPAHGNISNTGYFGYPPAQITYTPNTDYLGPDSFTFTVSDGIATSTSAIVNIDVQQLNHLPAAIDQIINIDEDNIAQITLTGTDIDGNSLSYKIDANPSNGTLSGTPPSVEYTPKPNYNGTDSFKFKVNDGTVDSANTATVTINIKPVNDPPELIGVFDPIDTQEGGTLTMQFTGQDPDGGQVLLGCDNPPAGAQVYSASMAFSWTPDYTQGGNPPVSYTLSFYAYDYEGAKSSAKPITVNVKNTNRAPVITPISMKGVNENDILTFSVTASDPDGDSLTYSASNLPSGASFNPSTQIFSWEPDYTQGGEYAVNFTVTDNGQAPTSAEPWHKNASSIAVQIGVLNVNRPPVITSIGGLTAQPFEFSGDEKSVIRLAIVATDPDGDTLTYSTSLAGATIDPNTKELIWTLPSWNYLFNVNGYVGGIYVYDNNPGPIGANGSTSASFKIIVKNLNDPPTTESDTKSAYSSKATTINLQGCVRDPDGIEDIASIMIVTSPEHGSFTLVSGEKFKFTYNPDINYYEDYFSNNPSATKVIDTVTFKATDIAGLISADPPATLTIEVYNQ